MTPDTPRFENAIAAFDAANAQDPNRETFDGHEHPKELLYARRMTAWLDRIAPDAPEAVRLAARAQHVRRWTIPRGDYPMDRPGYHRWRTTLQRFHADTAGQLMRDAGYDDETIARVGALLRKERLKDDPDTQLLEDVICLVFLESYFANFARQHEREEEKLVTILRKTWKKMSPRAHAAALSLPLEPDARALVERALGGND